MERNTGISEKSDAPDDALWLYTLLFLTKYWIATDNPLKSLFALTKADVLRGKGSFKHFSIIANSVS